MVTINKEPIIIKTEQDAVFLRNRITEYTVKLRMGLLNQTKLLTAASELVRNMLQYAGGGRVICEIVSGPNLQTGIKLTFIDKGPGIKNLDSAMRDGYSTNQGLGVGLPGAKRLVSEFDIKSKPGKGTTVMIIKWGNG